jgi:tRNA 2-thiouridine synthesizing protein A
MADVTLDVRGLKCPLPILRANRALGRLAGGASLEVLTTDPGAVPDFEDFCRVTGHELVEHAPLADAHRFVIRARAG